MVDIAANKVHTLFIRARARDYVDLYFLLTKKHYSLLSLISDAKAKFDWDIDRVNLASQFIRAKELTSKDLPTMLVKFDRKKMVKFFIDQARNLKKEIFI